MTNFADLTIKKKEEKEPLKLTSFGPIKHKETGLEKIQEAIETVAKTPRKKKKKWCVQLIGDREGWNLETIVVRHPGRVNGKDLYHHPNIFQYGEKLGEILGHGIDECEDFPVYNYFIDFDHTDEVIEEYEKCTEKEQFYEYLKKYPLVCGGVKEGNQWKSKIFLDNVEERYVSDLKFKESRMNADILYECE